MTITVGTDTYITVADADTYVSLNRLSTDDQREAWDKLATADKEILLRQATAAIERIRFPGIKQDNDQTLSFPRYALPPTPKRRRPESSFYNDEWLNDTEVPDNVISAEVEEALELGSPGADSKRFDVMRGPVESYKIGQLSENFRLRSSSGNSVETILRSRRAQELLSLQAGGSYSVY